MARATSRPGTAWTSAIDVCAAARCEKSTSASCRAAGVLRRHCAPTRCDRSTLRTCGADERSKLGRPRPGPSPPHPSAGLGCPGPHGGARGGRNNDVPIITLTGGSTFNCGVAVSESTEFARRVLERTHTHYTGILEQRYRSGYNWSQPSYLYMGKTVLSITQNMLS